MGVFKTLEAKLGPLILDIELNLKLISTSNSSSKAGKMDAVNQGQLANVESAVEDTLTAVTGLVGDVLGDLDLADLSKSLANVKNDLEKALFKIESALGEIPALRPLILKLAKLLNGPLVQLLDKLDSALSGVTDVFSDLTSPVSGLLGNL
ncbi:hypothetical protein RQP46_010250 [Phenoliferia psychrophenolica]